MALFDTFFLFLLNYGSLSLSLSLSAGCLGKSNSTTLSVEWGIKIQMESAL